MVKMDHHCVFMAVCIGARNHRYYVQLLFYGVISGIFCIAQWLLWFSRTGKALKQHNDVLRLIFKVLLFFGFCILILVYLLVSLYLLLYHLRLVLFNMTTIEDLKKVNKGTYDFGVVYNLRRFFYDFKRMMLPLDCRTKFEGYFYDRVAEDREIDKMAMLPATAAVDHEPSSSLDLNTLLEMYKLHANRIPENIEYQFNGYKLTN